MPRRHDRVHQFLAYLKSTGLTVPADRMDDCAEVFASGHQEGSSIGQEGIQQGHDPASIAFAAEEAASTVIASSPGAALWACRQGCAHCCSGAISITTPEAFLLARAIREGLGPEQRASLIERIQAAAMEPATQQRACPLLNEDGTCIAYLYRPLLCRGYATMDAEACRNLRNQVPGATVSNDLVALFYSVGMMAGLQESITAAALDGKILDLPKGILWALDRTHQK